MSSRFSGYLLKRFGMAILTIFIVTALTFFIMNEIPASPFYSEKARIN